MTLRPVPTLLAAAVVAAVFTAVTAGTSVGYAWWVVAPGMAVVSTVVGVRRFRPSDLRPWRVLLAALGLLWVGWTMSAWIGAGLGTPATDGAVSAVRDVLYLVAYPMLGVVGLLFVRARTGGRDRDGVIDALLVMVALATGMGAWLFGTGEFAETLTQLDRLWISVAPLLLASVTAASVRIVFAAGGRILVAWLFVTASVLTLGGNLWTALRLRDGLPTQSTTIDVIWIVSFVVVTAAALHPSMRDLTEPAPAEALDDGMPTDRLVILGAALVAAPLANLRVADRLATDSILIAFGGVVIVVLALWRIARLLRERDVVRSTLAEVASHDAVVATVGRWALDERSTTQLVADVDGLLRDAIPGARCSVTALPDGASADETDPDDDGLEVVRLAVDDGSRHVGVVTARFDRHRSRVPGERDFLRAVAALLSAAARRRAAESQLRYDALHDPLTGLPNRTLVLDRVEQLLGRRDVTDVTAIFLDLDGFKTVNDSLGHEAGDVVLRDVATRLRRAVRSDETVARFAGDEFVVLVGHAERGPLEDLVTRLLDAATVAVPDLDLVVSASLGVASARRGTVAPAALLQRADEAMYQAKRRGGRVASWSPHDDVALRG